MPNANAIAKYEFAGQPLNVYGTPERPLFRASEVCAMLELRNVSQVCSLLEQDECEALSVEHSSSQNQALFVTEPGLYSLVLNSRKPNAKAFRKWITSEVLPSIRKTGSYSTGAAALAPQSNQFAIMCAAIDMLKAQAVALGEHDARLAALESAPTPHQLGAGTGYIAIVGWLVLRGVKHPGAAETAQMGRAAVKRCKALGYAVCKEPDAHYCTVNTYPIDVLDELFLEGV